MWFKKIQNFVRYHGFWKATLYLLAVIPEKAGIGIISIFVFSRSVHADSALPGRRFEVINSLSGLAEEDRRLLCSYKGKDALAGFERFFQKGHFCAVGRIDGKLGCVCWIKPIKHYFFSRRKADFLIRQCFTLPSERGKGLYPETLNFLCNYLRSAAAEAPKIILESSVFNYSSMRGLLKSGFRKERIALMFFGLRLYLGGAD